MWKWTNKQTQCVVGKLCTEQKKNDNRWKTGNLANVQSTNWFLFIADVNLIW